MPPAKNIDALSVVRKKHSRTTPTLVQISHFFPLLVMQIEFHARFDFIFFIVNTAKNINERPVAENGEGTLLNAALFERGYAGGLQLNFENFVETSNHEKFRRIYLYRQFEFGAGLLVKDVVWLHYIPL